MIVLENVFGALTSRQGKDFVAITSALSGSGYRFGAMVLNARLFVPQSRPRVFFVAVRRGEEIPPELVGMARKTRGTPPLLWPRIRA